MRALLLQQLRLNEDLMELIADTKWVDGRLFPTGSLGMGDIPPRPGFPFLLYTELPNLVHRVVQETAYASDRNFQVFVYDERGGYVRINQILDLVRDTVVGMTAKTSPSGAFCMNARWGGYSGDSLNEELDANMKWAAITLTSNR